MNKLHLPTEQYGFVEVEYEGSAEETIEEYRRLTKLATGGVGMDTKDFNRVLDQLLEKKSIEGDPGMVDEMNVEQQTILQAVKRSQARIKSKLN